MRDFLDFIQPPTTLRSYVEVRSIKDGRVRQWWETDKAAASALALKQSEEGWDAYYGVLPRTAQAGDSSAVQRTSSVLWADLDAKLTGSKQQCLMSLVRYRVPPSVVVDSGHGYHAYWRLEESVTWQMAHLAMKGLALGLNGDHVYDQARILRVPGTTNWKADPVPVRVIVFDTTNVRPFNHFGPEVEAAYADMPEPVEAITVPYVPQANRPDLPSWLVERIQIGAPQGQRSEQCFKVMCHLAKRGYSDSEIHAAFEGGMIGEKMREMRGGERWFERSLTRARQNLR